jgi:putative spermidine/putrescine transport system ATP-binding protein
VHLLAATETADTMLEGVVSAVEYTGDAVQLIVDTVAGRVPIDLGTRDGAWRGLRPGEVVRVGWAAQDSLCFPA